MLLKICLFKESAYLILELAIWVESSVNRFCILSNSEMFCAWNAESNTRWYEMHKLTL